MSDTTLGQVPEDGGQEPRSDQLPDQATGATQDQTFEERFSTEYVRKLRAEAAEYRRRLRELENTVRQHEEAKLSETEKLQKRVAELEREQQVYQQERQERTLQYETMLAATRLGIVDPEAAYRLLDVAKLQFNEDGKPVNLVPVLQELVQQRPYLLARGGTSPTNPNRPHVGLTLDDVKRMSPDEINTRWDEVQRVLASQR